MDNYSYADSGDSSPHSRTDADFDNVCKVKFMCSYGGKIKPRPHDNQLSYVGGETKILAVHRSVTFATLIAKLKALCHTDVSFKYQLPGEDLDALISVTNDDDLAHMMHEHDRLPSPAKLRLFLLPANGQSPALTPVNSFGSTTMDALNSGHLQSKELMLGLEKEMVQIPEQEPDAAAVIDDRIQKHIHDLQKLGIAEPPLYRKPSNENLTAYVPKETAPQISPDQHQQPVYMFQAPPASVYHTPNANGYYYQRMPVPDQPLYNVIPQPQPQTTVPDQPLYNVIPQPQTIAPPQQQFVAQTYTEVVTDSAYGQVAGAGRQIYYTTQAHAPVVAVAQPLQQPYQAMAVTLNPETGAKEFI
ncbi:putative PB1 domain-containing protein [Helianthus annuus]|uniref:PB1 domain-containing protein n=1 Tax=Helianthus annuus TaxID=4232 RepID=A0A251VM35_HELAN|nr:uncharacterized protein LOC110867828 [Helianthus annuus]KAF5759102.1 putative PB1 domain-containing protein [Helianthus annuus]KAJ0437345.1 putative PB1 domain-containing protein [Helianthus annuus]KAJ0459660.1 putative PB1 domain-containing protein [Helianthus annuus]KAJ0640141.1 putative PB1 domain-containing protein [Helianthus annuus]KAJ0644098.1 putative PB1 domain-containing protein [Helianthus annuus]